MNLQSSGLRGVPPRGLVGSRLIGWVRVAIDKCDDTHSRGSRDRGYRYVIS